MRVLHIIDSLGAGGAEKLIVETVPEFVKCGIKVDVLLLNGERTPFYTALEVKKCCRIFSLGKSFYNPVYIFKIIPFLKNYDIVHVHLFPAQYFTVIAKLISLSKVKLVFTEHNTENRRLNTLYFKPLEKFIYRFYEKIICITDEVRNVLVNKLGIYDNKLNVIENGIKLSEIRESKAISKVEYGFKKSDKLIIMVAAFRSQKDQDTVVKSLLLLPSNYHVILVGDGVRRTILEGLAIELKLENRVHFLGFRSDVYSLIKMCDIAVLSSHWEGFGLSAVESMACGIPTVASNVQGLANVVEGGGLVFERGNEDDLKEKILSLEREGFYAEVAQKCINKALQYDISVMVNKILHLYKDLWKN